MSWHNRKRNTTTQKTQKSSPFFYRAAADTSSVLICFTLLSRGLGDPEPSAISVDSAATSAVALISPLPCLLTLPSSVSTIRYRSRLFPPYADSWFATGSFPPRSVEKYVWPAFSQPKDTMKPQIESLWQQSQELFCLAYYRRTVRVKGQNHRIRAADVIRKKYVGPAGGLVIHYSS
jgi:hypothetical protein